MRPSPTEDPEEGLDASDVRVRRARGALAGSLLLTEPVLARSSAGIRLRSFEEAPAINTVGTGLVVLTVDEAGTAIGLELTYANLHTDVFPGEEIRDQATFPRR